MGPRGVTIVGSTAHVAAYFGDEVLGVNLEGGTPGVESRIALGPKVSPPISRRGEILFHDATIGFQGWQSCASCHPDVRADGLNWDLLNDGLGNPKNTRSLLLAHSTPPTTASGVRDDAEGSVRAGFHHILFTTVAETDAQAVDAFLKALRPEPGPALVDGQLSPAAERGRQLFEGDRLGCAACHPAPLYTDLRMHDVASRGPRDDRDTFDTPTLVESWRTAPYLHDGRYATLRALFREGSHGDVRGDIDGLSDDELADLIEFLRSL